MTRLYCILACAGFLQLGLMIYWLIDPSLVRDLEVAFAVKHDRDAKATEIALTHFPVGSNLDAALGKLKQSGFEITNVSYTISDKNWRLPDTKESYIVSKDGYGYVFPFNTKTLKIFIDAEHGRIIQLRARAYHEGF